MPVNSVLRHGKKSLMILFDDIRMIKPVFRKLALKTGGDFARIVGLSKGLSQAQIDDFIDTGRIVFSLLSKNLNDKM